MWTRSLDQSAGVVLTGHYCVEVLEFGNIKLLLCIENYIQNILESRLQSWSHCGVGSLEKSWSYSGTAGCELFDNIDQSFQVF